MDVLINGTRCAATSAASAWTSSSSTSARMPSTSARATRRSCSDPAPPGNRPRRTGPTCSAPSTTRSSPVREAGSSGRIAVGRRRSGPVSNDENAGAARPQRALAGRGGGPGRRRHLAGSTVARSLTRRTTERRPATRGEDFELLDADRSSVVTTPDGVDLAVREVGPRGRAADGGVLARILSAHGRASTSSATRLGSSGGQQVRMVFYDQRGHGQSGGGAAGHLHRRPSWARTSTPCSP